jgi:hypothetical protein
MRSVPVQARKSNERRCASKNTIYIHNAHAARTGGLCIRGAERPGEMGRTEVDGAAWGLGV